MRAALFGVLAAAISVTACGGSSSPAAPSGSLQTVKTLTVSGQSMAATETQQFTATATMEDGTVDDVSARAKWSSSDPTVASVSPTGLVTGIKAGAADIRVTYLNKSALKNTTIRPLKISTLSGVVSHVPPDFGAVAGVTVQVLDGPNQSQSTATDGNGFYAMDLHEGTFNVSFSRDGYVAVTKQVTLQDATKKLDLLLYMTPPPGATARCKDKSWSFAVDRGSVCSRSGLSYYVCPGPFCTS